MTLANFTLYTSNLSANGRKVLAVSQHLGLMPEVNEVNVYEGEGSAETYRTLNPFGKIPTLVHDDFVLWESNAIIQYIDDAFGESRLSGDTPRARADVARWLFWEAAHWQPAITTVLAAHVGHVLLPQYVPVPTQTPEWDYDGFLPLIHVLEAHLADRTYLVDNTLTLADFSVAAMMTYFQVGQFPFIRYPAVTRWYESLSSLAAWQQTAVKLWQP